MKSILDNDHCCFVCRRPYPLHRHHIYGGPKRQISEENGFWVYLCDRHHNMSKEGVHFNKALDTCFKQWCQKRYEETHTRDHFIELIGKNYLEGD